MICQCGLYVFNDSRLLGGEAGNPALPTNHYRTWPVISTSRNVGNPKSPKRPLITPSHLNLICIVVSRTQFALASVHFSPAKELVVFYFSGESLPIPFIITIYPISSLHLIYNFPCLNAIALRSTELLSIQSSDDGVCDNACSQVPCPISH